MPLLRACLASVLVPLHEGAVPQQFKDIFGVTEDLPEPTTTAPVQNWEDLTPEEQEAAKDGLIRVVGAPANVVATAKHIMQEKARKEQAADEEFEGGNQDENDEDEEERSPARAPRAKAPASEARGMLAEGASPMHALASTVAEAETEDSDADATDPTEAAPAVKAPTAADAPPAASSLRGSAAAATTARPLKLSDTMADWPMPDLDLSNATDQSSVAAATSTTTSASVSSSATTSAASVPTTTPAAAAANKSAGFDVNSIARLHAMLAAAEAADAHAAPVRAPRAGEGDEEDPGDEEAGGEDEWDYDNSVRAVSRKKVGLESASLNA